MNETGRPWYPFYVGDYSRKTAHLSLLEHGAYRLLLDHYYATREPLPADTVKLYRICRARTPSERRAVDAVVNEFFTKTVSSPTTQFDIENESLLRNEKCDREIDKMLNYSKSQSANAKRRLSHGTANAYARVRVSTTTTTEEERKEQQVVPKETKKGTRLSVESLPADWKDFCTKNRPDLDPQAVFDGFRDFWIAKAGRDGAKLDWFATWRNWVRGQRLGAVLKKPAGIVERETKKNVTTIGGKRD
ncbi:MAG: YdaU family protein [Sterolibacterium sp.]